ncbi:MAG: response regulator transcription factor [Bdellovibrio sp.]
MSKKKILIVEDEHHIAEGLSLSLRLANYESQIAYDGELALKLIKEFNPDLVLLDLMIPKVDGMSVLKELRQTDQRMPVLILSAKNEIPEKVKALKIGVDDYLSKPFDLDELLLRIDRLLTRSSWAKGIDLTGVDQFTFDGGSIDFVLGKAMTPRGEIQLTEQEMKLLKLFIQNPNVPLPRGRLLEAGWGMTGETNTRTIDNFIVRMRKYFEDDPKNPEFFKSIRSIGYMFSPHKK